MLTLFSGLILTALVTWGLILMLVLMAYGPLLAARNVR
jgi:hypothetical protein